MEGSFEWTSRQAACHGPSVHRAGSAKWSAGASIYPQQRIACIDDQTESGCAHHRDVEMQRPPWRRPDFARAGRGGERNELPQLPCLETAERRDNPERAHAIGWLEYGRFQNCRAAERQDNRRLDRLVARHAPQPFIRMPNSNASLQHTQRDVCGLVENGGVRCIVDQPTELGPQPPQAAIRNNRLRQRARQCACLVASHRPDHDIAHSLGLCDAIKQAVHRAVEMCFLENVLHQSVDTLSKGYRHRTCFAQSIIHDPEILVMDEPTDGLDPNQKHEIRQLIKRMGEKKAIIFSTHILEEVEAACTRAIIIDRGTVVANGTPLELKRKAPNAGAILLRVNGVAAEAVTGKLRSVDSTERVQLVKEDGGRVTVRVFPKSSANGEFSKAIGSAAQGWCVEELHVEEGKLDEYFRSITASDTAKK